MKTGKSLRRLSAKQFSEAVVGERCDVPCFHCVFYWDSGRVWGNPILRNFDGLNSLIGSQISLIGGPIRVCYAVFFLLVHLP